MTTRSTQQEEGAGDTEGRTPKAGEVLAERYRLLHPLGSGGMGVVWEALHVGLDTKVAIKLIDPRRAGDERARQRFVREAKSAASLESPHVVQIRDYGLHEGAPYIAMERLEGESLADRLARVGMLSPTATLAVVEHVGRAIAKAHASEIVHRDLKPDNIFLCETDEGELAKVLDFGIAKGLTDEGGHDITTGVGGVLGTPHYMSPEQLMNASDCDARSDLWALAVIVYECLLGQKAYTADSVAELAVAVLAEPAPIPSDHGQVPDGFDAWFERATRRDPAERFATLADMLDALRPGLLGTRAMAAAAPAEPKSKRGAAWIGLAGAAALGLGVVAFAPWKDHDGAREATAPAASPPAPQRPRTPDTQPAASAPAATPPSPSTTRDDAARRAADIGGAPESGEPPVDAETAPAAEASPSAQPAPAAAPPPASEPPSKPPRGRKPRPRKPASQPKSPSPATETEPEPAAPPKKGYDLDELERP